MELTQKEQEDYLRAYDDTVHHYVLKPCLASDNGRKFPISDADTDVTKRSFSIMVIGVNKRGGMVTLDYDHDL